MENNARVTVCLSFRLIFAPAVIALIVLCTNSTVLADGKLHRVKEAVRKHDPKPASRPSSNRENRNESRDQERPSHNDSDQRDDSRHEDDDHRPNRGGHHNHGSRSGGIVFYSPPRRDIQPVVIPVVSEPVCPIQEHVIIQQQYSAQAPVPQPVFESVVNEPAISTGVGPDAQVVLSPANEWVSPPPMGDAIVVVDNGVGQDWFETDISQFWATIGSDFDGITSGGMGLNLQSLGGIGLDGSIMTLRESTESYRDHLWIGDANLVCEVVSGSDIRGRVGLGVNWLSDSWGAEAGFNLTAGVDFRLTDRAILSAEGDVGNLGDADFFHGRVNLARRFETCEWMLGVDHYNIGGAEVNSFFTGLLFRF